MKILIVEDDKIVAMLLKRLFLRVTTEEKIFIAENIHDAKEVILKIPPPDIVTLDLALPDSLNPAETLNVIYDVKQRNPNAVVVVMTGIMEDLTEKAKIAEADGFIHKMHGLNTQTLMESVRSALNNKMPFERRLDFLERITAAMN